MSLRSPCYLKLPSTFLAVVVTIRSHCLHHCCCKFALLLSPSLRVKVVFFLSLSSSRCVVAVVTSSPLASTFPQNPTLALSRTHHTRGIAPLPLLQLKIFRCNQRNSTVIRVVTAILVPCHRRHRHLSISSSPRASP